MMSEGGSEDETKYIQDIEGSHFQLSQSTLLCIQLVLFHLSEHFSYLNTLWSQHVWLSDFLLSNTIPSHISSVSSSLTHYSTELPLGARLIHAMQIHEYLIHLRSVYDL